MTIEEPPKARIETGRRQFPLVWILPLAAALIGGWLVFQNFMEHGADIHIRFNNAEGLEAKKTRIKYKDIDVGVVNGIEFSGDLSHVIVTAEIKRVVSSRFSSASRFWVVRPRIDGLSISGINTLLSGPYITVDPGGNGEPQRDFIGLEEPPTVLSNSKGSTYHLKARELGSITLGAPIYYRSIKVGEVVRYKLSDDHSHIGIDIYINAPHDAYVKQQSRFWHVGGIGLDLSAEGISLDVQSLTTLLAGGVAFDSPGGRENGVSAEVDSAFVLYDDKQQSEERPITITVPYLVYFDDTVRGLTVNAPVEFRGIRVGTVQDIRLEKSADEGSVRIPVLLGIEPERLITDQINDNDKASENVRNLLAKLVGKGLRARLQTGNLLTGQLFIELDFHPELPPGTVSKSNGYPVLPATPSALSSITRNLNSLLVKLERVPIEEIGAHLKNAAKGVDELVNDQALTDAVQEMLQVMKQSNQLLSTMSRQTGPLMNNVSEVAANAKILIKTSTEVMEGLRGITSHDGVLGNELLATLEELSAAARSIRIMAEYLERHPESLLKGKSR
ncbi:MAG: MlaD family protein [Sedimenticola sp.]